MGLFDTIRFIDPNPDQEVIPKCAAGHLMLDLQTKDFDPDEHTTYIVWKSQLYKLAERHDPDVEDPKLVDMDMVVTMTTHTRYRRIPHNGPVTAYTHCDECLPVLFETGGKVWHGDIVTELEPWCEWDLKFKDGRLIEINPIRVESREDVAKKNHTIERAHIPDTDHIAKRHFERNAEHRAKVGSLRHRR